ncbi:MAG: hypothetical protein LQ348_006790 [Seirophora lacunosa]|nr:MAG: hypothetical protein LQ348_006790 [Seirophora lacunosa]
MDSNQGDLLQQILTTLQTVQNDCKQLSTAVREIRTRLDAVTVASVCHPSAIESDHNVRSLQRALEKHKEGFTRGSPTIPAATSPSLLSLDAPRNSGSDVKLASPQRGSASEVSSRIILTTYPGQSGIDPVAMSWGHPDPAKRGPVVVARSQSTIRRRNGMRLHHYGVHSHSRWQFQSDAYAAIGAHGGSYSVYHALAVASKDLDLGHKADFTNAQPAVSIGPFPQWADVKKIVSLDPFGHMAPWLYNSIIRDENINIRPTIAVTRAHMKLPELEQSVRAGRLVPDGKICLNGTDEGTLRRSLFENTGGSFPELITRGDMKLFLPPIGGLTVYCFGDPARMSDPSVKLALRIHDECNGSDVFGSDICTCRPYLVFGVEEAVKEAQRGGSGVVVYFRKEGRALGEVTKYLVYNARKCNVVPFEQHPTVNGSS